MTSRCEPKPLLEPPRLTPTRSIATRVFPLRPSLRPAPQRLLGLLVPADLGGEGAYHRRCR